MDHELAKLNTKFDVLNVSFKELTAFLIDQFSKVATKDDLKKLGTELRSEMATKSDLAELRTEMTTKGELAAVDKKVDEIQEIVQRLDRRTEADIRATMKDVHKIKTVLAKQGHKI